MEHDRNKIFIEIVFLISVEFLHLKLWAVSPRLICQYVDTQPTRAQPLLLLTSFYMGAIPDICNFFSTDTIFGSIFLHTKACKSQQNSVKREKYEIAHSITQMTDVEKSKISAGGVMKLVGAKVKFYCFILGSPSYILDSSE